MTISLYAEWSKQSAVLLAWPHPDSDWQANLTDAERVYTALVRQITHFESVVMIYRDNAHLQHIKSVLKDNNVNTTAIVWTQQRTNDTWARDFGPITVTDGTRPVLLDFTFNGWGNKYNAADDNQVNRQLHQDGIFSDLNMRHYDFILEGGSIDYDGEGTLLTTKNCLLAPTRNPTLTENEIELELSKMLGVKRTLWLAHGELHGDDTDSHIDMLARFCDPETIAYCSCENPADEHYIPLQQMYQELMAFRRTDGKPYRLVALPLPQAKYDDDGQRLPASYANFLIINDAVLLPVYDDPADVIAVQQLQACFPDREIITINCLPLIRQFGSLHCVTMQLPLGVITQ